MASFSVFLVLISPFWRVKKRADLILNSFLAVNRESKMKQKQFGGQFLEVAKSDNDTQEDLAKSGYKPNMKVIFKLSYFFGYVLLIMYKNLK